MLIHRSTGCIETSYQLNVLEFDLTFCLKGTSKDVHTK